MNLPPNPRQGLPGLALTGLLFTSSCIAGPAPKPQIFLPETTWEYVGLSLGIVLLVLIFTLPMVWTFYLRRQVAARTQSLEEEIRKHRQVENALRESEEHLRLSEMELKKAQSVARLGSWKWGIKTGEVTWSDEMFTIFGIDRSSYTGRLGGAIQKVIHPDDLHLVLPSNAGTFAEKKPVEYRIYLPDHSIRYIWALSGEAILDEQGNPLYLTGIAQDITERKKQEEEIRLLANFPSENTNPVMRIDPTGNIVYANHASQPILATWNSQAGGSLPADWHAHLQTAFATGQPIELELECGDQIFDLVLVPVLNRGYLNIYGRNITEQIHIKRDLERSNTDLEQFAYVASHDLQEPLRMVSSFMQLIKERYKGRLDQDADEFIDFAVDGAERMRALINDLLQFSRVSTRGQPFSQVSCEEVLAQVLHTLEPSIQETHARITHTPLPVVLADEVQLGEVFQNLLSNALKFREKKAPRIHIALEDLSTEWVFSVRDNGIGFDEKYLERIFMLFQRLNERANFQGTGLGLAICKKIVERHGGRIWATSQRNKGATFYFSIPKQRVNS